MRIVVKLDKYPDVTVDFIAYLINLIQELLLQFNDYDRLIQIEVFINSMYKSVLKRYISCKEIVYSSVKSITYETFTNMYIIKIDDNALLPMTRVKIIDLVKLINYGNLWINGLPIYSKIFNGVQKNIDNIYERYLMEKEV